MTDSKYGNFIRHLATTELSNRGVKDTDQHRKDLLKEVMDLTDVTKASPEVIALWHVIFSGKEKTLPQIEIEYEQALL